MARKKQVDAAKDKAAKQKKLAIGLVVMLALALAYAVHTMTSLNKGAASSRPQAAPAAATTTAAPAQTPPPTTTPPVATPAATPASTPSAGSSQLVSAVTPPAGAGQLESFSRFETKDPFAAGAPPAGNVTGSGSPGTGTSKPPAAPPKAPVPAPTSAVIAVNGLAELVTSGSNFPVASPTAGTNGLFQLTALTKSTATVAVVGGSYASGSATLTLTVNKPVTLVNTADGTRYTLVLYPQGTAAPAAPPPAGTTTTTATTPAAPATPPASGP